MNKKLKNKKPYFSIITVVLNGEKYLSRAIKSVANQNFKNFEPIIIELSEKLSIEPLIIFSVIINLFSKFSFLMPRARTPSDRLFKDANN